MERNEPVTIYEKIGGAKKVRQLVEAFYPRVIKHPLLKPIFPEDILPVMEKQYLFLTQFFGGPRSTAKNTDTPCFGHATCLFPSPRKEPKPGWNA